ncbi:SHOCT domain-containing protein [Streptomyces albus subsp. chlorinus]|uniref:SHOCT domain-containing protein n=1 Tax=Streptomyces albus TaxID=1888 RepID=UPI00156F0E1E|nr:SHOCT domain-containing protein [Streptomyces albus]NSC20298.1 SHOCT domain-containing protein [Streptomyces albus subsp. chlorinus]
MELLAHWHDGSGPGPWVLLFPLVWAAVLAGGVHLLRRLRPRGRRGPWQPHAAHGPHSPVGLLDRRFARGEIDEDEYWRRASVLHESARDRYREAGGGKH